MRTTRQNVEVTFNAIEIEDAITMVPIMDVLKTCEANENFQIAMFIESMEDDETVHNAGITIPRERAKKMLKILQNLGFVGNNILQPLKSEKEETNSKVNGAF